MSTAKLVLNKQGRYIPSTYEHDEIGALALFLAFHIKDEGFFFCEWLKNLGAIPDYYGNFCLIGFWVKDRIRIKMYFNNEQKESKELEIRKKDLTKIVKTWMKLYKKKPKKIIIKLHKNRITINDITVF